MLVKLILGIAIGSGIGALMGYFGKCTDGSCPLTANPWRGAIYGGVMGTLFSLAMGGGSIRAENVPTELREAGAQAVVNVDSEDAYRATLASNPVTLVDFYSDTCPPCRALAPSIDKLAAENQGKAAVVKVNVGKLSGLANELGVNAVPTVIIFKDGKEVERMTGMRKSEAYQQVLDRLVSSESP